MMKYSVVISIVFCLFGAPADFQIILQDNGYSNILVAISEDIPQPSDGGIKLLNDLKELLTETSKVLYTATNYQVYLKDVAILIPPSWGIEGSIITRLSFQNADIHLVTNGLPPGIPFTFHSGKCGVAGGFIMLPIDYLEDSVESVTIRAKEMVQQWAQFRYGVFEEHGFPNDDMLPYFYRHPNGFDAVSTSNDSVIVGDLESLSGGGSCDIDENGVITNQGDCRFIPSALEQTATTSLMSFHWLDSVIRFSDQTNHDWRPSHRQNRLCRSRSSSEIIYQSPDFIDIQPKPDQDPTPTITLLQNPSYPVVYLAIDTSKPSSSVNGDPPGQNIFKQGLRNLFNLLGSYPELYVAWSTFEGIDSSEDFYLNEEIPPTPFAEAEATLANKVNNFVYNPNVIIRDVSAVIRDAESRLRQYRDVGGSILYVITSTGSTTNDTVIETDMAERLLVNNIKLVVAESGPAVLGKSLSRFAVLSQGSYYFRENWETTAFFTPIDQEIETLCRNGLVQLRRTIQSKKGIIRRSEPWSGTFMVDNTIGINTTTTLRSPTKGTFTISITKPSGEQLTMTNEQEVTNWNAPDSVIGVTWNKILDIADIGSWDYTITYDPCTDCDQQPEIHLLIGSSIRSQSSLLPSFRPWVSLTAGSQSVDASKHPAVIQARFESDTGRLGGLSVTAEVVSGSSVVATITLSDSGTMDSDISHDGIYSGLFYPIADGTFTVTFHAVHYTNTNWRDNILKDTRLITSDQESYCCGSFIQTSDSEYFESSNSEALTFTVINSQTTLLEPPVIIDFQASTYGVDQNLVYAALTWTVPSNTESQIVKYSEDPAVLLDEFETAPSATVVSGSLTDVQAGSSVLIYVSAPYNQGKNVYLIVEITGTSGLKTRSHLTWTEPNPPNNVFTSPFPTSSPAPSSTIFPVSSTTVQTSFENSTFTEYSSTTYVETTYTLSTESSSSPTILSSTESSTSPTFSTDDSSPSTSFPDPPSSTTESWNEMTTESFSTISETPPSSTDFSTTITETLPPTSTSFSPPTDRSDSTSDFSDTPSSESSTTDSTVTTDFTPDSSISSSSDGISSASTEPSATSSTAMSTDTVSVTDLTTLTAAFPSSSTISSSTEVSVSSTTETNETTTVFVSSTLTITTESETTEIDTVTDSTISSTTDNSGNGDEDGLTSAQIGYIVGGVVVTLVIIAGTAGGIVYKRRIRNKIPFSEIDSSSFRNAAPSAHETMPSSGSFYNDSLSKSSSIMRTAQVPALPYYDNVGVTVEDGDVMVTAL